MASDRSISEAGTHFGQWLSPEAVNRLPKVRRSFDLNRDPYIRAQMLGQPVRQEKSRSDASGGGSTMVKRDKPAPAYVPPRELRSPVVRRDFQNRWLAEQRDAALARTAKQQPGQNPSPAPVKGMKAPSR